MPTMFGASRACDHACLVQLNCYEVRYRQKMLWVYGFSCLVLGPALTPARVAQASWQLRPLTW